VTFDVFPSNSFPAADPPPAAGTRGSPRGDVPQLAGASRQRCWQVAPTAKTSHSKSGKPNVLNFKEANAQSTTLQQLSALHDDRWRRLSDPFQSDLRIPPDDWMGAIAHIHAMQGAGQTEMRM
jgi:hypothetical protein